jgi:hypothetical protein
MLKEENESVSEFNNCFSKIYFKIPQNVCPSDEFTLHCYFKAYDKLFGLLLREKDLHNLEEAQAAAIKLERNILGITKEMMSQGPQVADMEYREADEQAGAPIIPHITIQSMATTSTTPSLAHRGQQVLLHEVTSPVSW